MPKTKGLLLVMQTPKPGREHDHRDWYVATHLPDVCAIPGVIRGEFTQVLPDTPEPRWSHAAVYWLARDPAEFLVELFRRAGSGEWLLSDTLDPANTMMMLAEPITPRERAKDEPDADPQDRLIYIVLSNATPGDDDEFNEWYTGTHIPDVLAVPGFVAAQRFRFLDNPALKPSPFRYAALYEIRASEAHAAFADLTARVEAGRIPLTPTLMTQGLHAAPFMPLGIKMGAG